MDDFFKAVAGRQVTRGTRKARDLVEPLMHGPSVDTAA